MNKMSLWCTILRRNKIISRIHSCPNWYMNLDSKENGGKKILSYETKALYIIYPYKRNEFIRPNYEKNETIIRIHVCLNWQMNFVSKHNSGKKSFSYKAKASISFITMKGMSLKCLVMKRKEIIQRIWVCLSW